MKNGLFGGVFLGFFLCFKEIIVFDWTNNPSLSPFLSLYGTDHWSEMLHSFPKEPRGCPCPGNAINDVSIDLVLLGFFLLELYNSLFYFSAVPWPRPASNRRSDDRNAIDGDWTAPCHQQRSATDCPLPVQGFLIFRGTLPLLCPTGGYCMLLTGQKYFLLSALCVKAEFVSDE